MSNARPTPLGFLDGGGKMGTLMRTHDWSRSPLGPPVCWPDTLKAAIATCLASRFPMVVWWGPDLIMLYNDAWQPILGETKHPAGLRTAFSPVTAMVSWRNSTSPTLTAL